MLTNLPLLSLLIWVPIVGGVIVLLTGGDKKADLARNIGLAVSLISIVLCIPLYTHFNTHTYHMQFVENIAWIPQYNIYYQLGVDGISMPLILLTVFTTLIVVLASWTMVHKKVAQYLATFLIMQGAIIGVFASVDAVLFYVFWEVMLIPMYLCIGVWGSEKRSYAAIKFFLYTFLGSALMLIALLYLWAQSGSFNILDYYAVKMVLPVQILIFIAFFLAFAIKVPMWPVHTWLPLAHTEAPAGGSVILAAIMLKIGGYGFLRFSLPIVPDACRALDWVMIALSLVAIVYVGLVAIAQTDMKKLIAYSSIAHMGFVTLGSFMIFQIARHVTGIQRLYMSIEGGMVQMISHAFISGALFVGFGMLYERMHTRNIKDFGGVAHTMPIFASFFMLFVLANVGLPGTSGFVGEFMVLLSAFQASFWITFVAALTLIVGASYTLWMYKRVFFGPVAHETIATLTDVAWINRLILVLLAAVILLIGIYPDVLLNLFHPTVGHLLKLSMQSKL